MKGKKCGPGLLVEAFIAIQDANTACANFSSTFAILHILHLPNSFNTNLVLHISVQQIKELIILFNFLYV